MSSNIHSTRDARERTGVLQTTWASCAAASTADAIADLGLRDLNWQHRVQQDFIFALGLERHPTTLGAVAALGTTVLGKSFRFDVRRGLTLEGALRIATAGDGVILALAPQAPTATGHAVRLLAGDRTIPDFDLPTSIRNTIHNADDQLNRVQIFDPAISMKPKLFSVAKIRKRFDRAGGEILRVTRVTSTRATSRRT